MMWSADDPLVVLVSHANKLSEVSQWFRAQGIDLSMSLGHEVTFLGTHDWQTRNWAFLFQDPGVALLFKLTWGGQ